MPAIRVRWSEHEARKDYARPFGVTFLDDRDTPLASVAMNGRELLYYRQFQASVLTLLGEIFLHPEVESSSSPQGSWIDVVGRLIPEITEPKFTPVSAFESVDGRAVHIEVQSGSQAVTQINAAIALDYQEAQAVIAHQSGQLLRVPEIEALDDDLNRSRAWISWLQAKLGHLEPEYAVENWPWDRGA